jgi:hypothetical protein
MIRRNEDEGVTVKECNRRHGVTFWAIGSMVTILAAIIGVQVYVVGLGLDASKQADAAVMEVKVEARGHQEFRGEVLRVLKEIKEDLREVKRDVSQPTK